MTSPLLHPSGRPWTAADVNELHRYSDVDRDALSHHHTLGNKKNQAAPGDHLHDITVYTGTPVAATTSGTTGLNVNSVVIQAVPYKTFHRIFSGNFSGTATVSTDEFDSGITQGGGYTARARMLATGRSWPLVENTFVVDPNTVASYFTMVQRSAGTGTLTTVADGSLNYLRVEVIRLP